MNAETDAENDALADYRCKWCGWVGRRRSDKAWVKSICDASGYRTVHLMRVAPPASKSDPT